MEDDTLISTTAVLLNDAALSDSQTHSLHCLRGLGCRRYALELVPDADGGL